jgi:hypothetical protein
MSDVALAAASMPAYTTVVFDADAAVLVLLMTERRPATALLAKVAHNGMA